MAMHTDDSPGLLVQHFLFWGCSSHFILNPGLSPEAKDQPALAQAKTEYAKRNGVRVELG